MLQFNLDIIFHIIRFCDLNTLSRVIKLNKHLYHYCLQHRNYLFRNHSFLVICNNLENLDNLDNFQVRNDVNTSSSFNFFKNYINYTFIAFESGELKMSELEHFLFNCNSFAFKDQIVKIINQYNYIHRIYYTLINTRNQILDVFEKSVIKKKEWYRKVAFLFIQYGAQIDDSTFVEAVVAMDKQSVKFLTPLINERSYINGIPIVFVLQARRAQVFFQNSRHNQRTTFISSISNSLYNKFRKKNWFDYFRNRHWTPKQYYDYMLTCLTEK